MERLFRNSSYSPAAHPLPDPAAQAWVDEIDSRIQQHPATYHLETLTRKVQARLVAMLQVGGMVEGDSLEPEERVATEAWLGAITSSEEESAHTCARAEQMDIPRFCLQFKDFLFACAREPGVASKIKTWIQSHPDEDLVEACTVPDVDGMTLPLHLSRAWMQAVNAQHCQEEQDHRIGVVRQCFDLLSQVCPIEEWVWATNKASAWSWATGQAINLPMDEDLVGPHQARLTEFFNWAQQAGARIPAVTFIPGHPGPVSLLDSEALARAMEQAVSGEQFNSIGEAGLRIDLMAPLIGRLCQADMQAGVVGAEPRREGRPGRRL